ncbi:hypothetical protein RJT34_17117 [Clitoria ternatea]|uniref:Uncharacterized protein n=1 Tax=Clitoria ternatea TaxID=43366 RepID=A0AAN9PCU9_CLITE
MLASASALHGARCEVKEQRHATQDQIAYFGQTPSELLTVPHLKKKPLSEVLHLQTIFRNPKVVKPYVVPSREHCNLPAAAIHASSDMVVIVDLNAPAAHVAQHKWQPNTPDGQGTPFLFQHGKATSGSAGGTLVRIFKGPGGTGEESQYPQALDFAASGIRSQAIVSITCDKEIITEVVLKLSICLVTLAAYCLQLSLKVVDHMLKLGWEGDGLKHLIK